MTQSGLSLVANDLDLIQFDDDEDDQGGHIVPEKPNEITEEEESGKSAHSLLECSDYPRS